MSDHSYEGAPTLRGPLATPTITDHGRIVRRPEVPLPVPGAEQYIVPADGEDGEPDFFRWCPLTHLPCLLPGCEQTCAHPPTP